LEKLCDVRKLCYNGLPEVIISLSRVLEKQYQL